MTNSIENQKEANKRITIRFDDALLSELQAACDAEERDMSSILKDALRFYLVRSEGQKRFEILANQTTMASQQRIHQTMELVEAWVEEGRNDGRSNTNWMSQAKEVFLQTAMAMAKGVNELQDENRQLKQMLEQLMTLMGSMTNGGGGGYQPRQNTNSNQATPPKPPFSNLVNQSAPD